MKLSAAIACALVLSYCLSCAGYVKDVHRISSINPLSRSAELSLDFDEDSLLIKVQAYSREHTQRVGVRFQVENLRNSPVLLSAKEIRLVSASGSDLGDKTVVRKLQPDSMFTLDHGLSWLDVDWKLSDDERDRWIELSPLVLRTGPFMGISNQQLLHLPEIFVFRESIRVSY